MKNNDLKTILSQALASGYCHDANASIGGRMTDEYKFGTWYPMDTAPQDGSKFLCFAICDDSKTFPWKKPSWTGCGEVMTIGYYATGDCLLLEHYSDEGCTELMGIKWMPLPNKPEEE
jgi:hypothetical protein